jgi:hypothetical protein
MKLSGLFDKAQPSLESDGAGAIDLLEPPVEIPVAPSFGT